MNEKCGCKIVYGHKLHDVGLLTDTVTISYCPLHAAAPLLLEALKAMHEWLNDDWPLDGARVMDHDVILPAIAAAEPDFYQDEPSHAFTGEVSNIKTYPKVLSPEETLEEFEKGKVE